MKYQSNKKGKATGGERLLLDADEAVTLLGLSSRKSLYKLTREGEIPAVRIGRFLKYRRDSLVAWIEQQERVA